MTETNAINNNTQIVTNQNSTCYDTAKKHEEVTGRSFGVLSQFYFLLIDCFATYFEWAKQRQIVEVKNFGDQLEKRDQIYAHINKNYTICDANVSHIEDAEVICLGEIHGNQDHKTWNTQLIDALCDEDQDLVLKEYDERHSPKSLRNFQLTDLKHKNLKIKGWDRYEHSDIIESEVVWINYNKARRALQELKTAKNQEIFFHVSSACTALAYLLDIISLSPGIPLLIAMQCWSVFSRLRAEKQFDEARKNSIATEEEKIIAKIPERNRHMCQVIQKELSSARKVFVIGGKTHFQEMRPPFVGEDKDEWRKKYVDHVQETLAFLKQKKFAILIPNE